MSENNKSNGEWKCILERNDLQVWHGRNGDDNIVITRETDCAVVVNTYTMDTKRAHWPEGLSVADFWAALHADGLEGEIDRFEGGNWEAAS